VRSHQVSSAANNANNVPNVRTSEAVDTVQPRCRVWRLDSETEINLVHQRNQNRSCREVTMEEVVDELIILSKGMTSSLMLQLNLMIRLDLV